MGLFNDREYHHSDDQIFVSEALRNLREDYLSERHSRQLLLDLLESGRLKAYGVPDYTDPSVGRKAIQPEQIETDFWLGMDESWDEPARGLDTNRFTSSGTGLWHDFDLSDDRCSDLKARSDQKGTNVHADVDIETEAGPPRFPKYYRDVQVSWKRLLVILEQLGIGFEPVDVDAADTKDIGLERSQPGRKMSAQWPVWIGQACKLAHEHRFHRKTTANEVVRLVEKEVDGLSIARSTVRLAAERIVEAIRGSSAKHRFDTNRVEPEYEQANDV